MQTWMQVSIYTIQICTQREWEIELEIESDSDRDKQRKREDLLWALSPLAEAPPKFLGSEWV